MRIFPRICCNTLLLTAAMLIGSSFGAAQASRTTNNPATGHPAAGSNQQAQLEGVLEIIHQDFKDGHGRYLYSLKQADGTRVPLHFTKQPPTHLLTGDHVRANGQLSSGTLTLYSGSTSITKTSPPSNTKTGPPPPSIPVPYTFGAQSTLVILVNFQDDVVEPYTVADAQNAFFVAANNFFMENSYGQTSLTGTVLGWYTVTDSVTTCNMSQMATDAQNAASAAGANLSNYTRYVYVFPYNAACGWAGSSVVGGNPSQSWINGSLDYHTIDHELGHAFGVWHSHSLDCGTTATICSSGTVSEYGDRMDVMGTVQTASPHYDAFQKERLGWLNYGGSPSIQTVTTTGTYTINPYELGGPGPNALKILKSTDSTTGAKTWYYLEARQAVGFDAFLTDGIYYTQNETSGVLFHMGTDGNGNTSDLLDMTPATPTSAGWFDMSLVVGQTFSDSNAGVTVMPTAVSGTGATVQITMNGSGSSCSAANPTVSISPSTSQYVTSGTPVNFTATVTDNDSSGCLAATFNLAAALPSGWSGVWSAASLSLSPGKSSSATLTVISPAGTADGSYNVSVSATSASASSYSGSAAATYSLNSAPLSITLSTNQSSYLPGQMVTVAVAMFYGTLPDADTSVKVTVTPPNGKVITLSGTTGSNGVALLNYNLSKHAAAGTYQALFGTTVTGATVTGASATIGASTSFTVQ